jgi:hypothetical protein
MTEPGSQDNNPPRIIAGNEYEFVAIATPGNHYDLIISTNAPDEVSSRQYVVARLRDIANRIEGPNSG